MEFTSFYNYARSDLKCLKIQSFEKNHTLYTLHFKQDALNPNALSLQYKSLKHYYFKENDTLLLCHLEGKIILFHNLTQKEDNFKEAKIKHCIFLCFLGIFALLFALFTAINAFALLYLILLSANLILLVLAFINLGLLFKQIRILKTSKQSEIEDFLKQNLSKNSA